MIHTNHEAFVEPSTFTSYKVYERNEVSRCAEEAVTPRLTFAVSEEGRSCSFSFIPLFSV